MAPSGCTSFWDSKNFPIVVSPDSSVDPVFYPSIASSLDAWNAAVGDLTFVLKPLTLAGTDNPGIVLSHKDLTHPRIGYCPVTYLPGYYGMRGLIWRGQCSIDPEAQYTTESYVKTLTHELGHALGFKHDEDQKSIMYYKILRTRQKIMSVQVTTTRAMMRGTYKYTNRFGFPTCL